MAVLTGGEDQRLPPEEVFLRCTAAGREAIYGVRQLMERGGGVRDWTGRGRRKKGTVSHFSGSSGPE